MTIEDFGRRVCDIGLRVDGADLAALEQSGENRPVVSAAVGTGGETVPHSDERILRQHAIKLRAAGSRLTQARKLLKRIFCHNQSPKFSYER